MTDMTHVTGEVPSGPAADAAGLMDMLLGIVRAQVLHAVAALHIADHLAEGARTAEEVAEREGSQARATFRLMRAAASLGVLRYQGDRRFGLTGMGYWLRSGVPGSLRAFVLVQAGHAHWQCWGCSPTRCGRAPARPGGRPGRTSSPHPDGAVVRPTPSGEAITAWNSTLSD